MTERSYGETRPAAESLPATGVPETEDEAAERAKAQQEEDVLDREQREEDEEPDDL